MTDFAALLRMLVSERVEFIVVGGAAAVAHGSARLTADLDIVYQRTPDNINRLVNGDIIWAPAIDGAFVLTTRGGDFDLQLGTDVSIGYLSHDADSVQLYLQETLTFVNYTGEASVALTA